MHNRYLLRVEDLCYKIGDKEINSGITFVVEKGDLISIVGPNEWKMLYIGSFKLMSNNKWEKIDE